MLSEQERELTRKLRVPINYGHFSKAERAQCQTERKAAADLIDRLTTLPAPQAGGEIERDNPQFNQGVQHVVELLAKALNVKDWIAGDGSEDYDDDLTQTLLNILSEKGLYDKEDGTFAALRLPHAGEGPEPATLAADTSSSPSASRRGEPAPEEIEAVARAIASSIQSGPLDGDWVKEVAAKAIAALRSAQAPVTDANQFDRIVQKIDDAEQTLSQMYYLVTGRSPVWSKTFGHQEAIDEVKDALLLLRSSRTYADGIEDAAKVAESESELPSEPSPRELAIMKAVGLVEASRAAVRATKNCIASRIRALSTTSQPASK